jgi:hypothetical protein
MQSRNEAARRIAMALKLAGPTHPITSSTPERFAEKVKLKVEKFRKIIVDSKMQQD